MRSLLDVRILCSYVASSFDAGLSFVELHAFARIIPDDNERVLSVKDSLVGSHPH